MQHKNYALKNLNIIFYIAIILTLFNCGSVSNYANKNLNKDFYRNNTICFYLKPTGEKNVKMSGLYQTTIFDDPNPPNTKMMFKQSIEELSKETKTNLIFTEETEKIPDNCILIKAEIKNISWHFGFSNATMKTLIYYSTQNLEKYIEIEGIHKSFGGGSKKNNLKKSLKNANFEFLKRFENNTLHNKV